MSETIKILLVEDNIGDAGLLRAAISEVPPGDFIYEVAHVTRISEAAERLRESLFNIVLLDLSLPDSHGLDTVIRIREAAPAVPIVVLSGLSDEKVAVEAMRSGAEDYLVKGQIDSEMLVRSINYAIERKGIEAQFKLQQEKQNTLRDINLAVTSTLDLPSVLRTLLDKVSQLLPDFAFSIRLYNQESDTWEAVASHNIDVAEWRAHMGVAGSGIAQAVIESGKPVAIVDLLADPRLGDVDLAKRNHLISYLGVPLVVKNQLVGVMGFFAKSRHEFEREEIEFLSTLAGQTAIAIHNSRLFEQVKQAHDALEKALEIKSVLVGVMGHELKNPIQVILGNASLLADNVFGELTEEQRERVRTIEASGQELVRLIESALDMARLERGKMLLHVSDVCIASIFRELELEFRDGFAKKQVALSIVAPDPGIRIQTDDVKLKEILRNLIENARKYSSEGRVEVKVEAITENFVVITVADTGKGISADLLPKIFDLFYQVDATKREHASAGLGLNIVKSLVNAMEGEITVASQIGHGTTFSVKLPRALAGNN